MGVGQQSSELVCHGSYAYDLVLIVDSEVKLLEKLKVWKRGFEEKGLKVNVEKTKVMRCTAVHKAMKESGKFPCAVCLKGVGSNSICCNKCKMWVHKKCSWCERSPEG